MNDEMRRKAIKTYYERNNNSSSQININRDLRKKIKNAFGNEFWICFSFFFPSTLIFAIHKKNIPLNIRLLNKWTPLFLE